MSHLMRVASGLDSLVLGEPQILGQVKSVCGFAKGHLKASELERMFQKSFSVAKRVRTRNRHWCQCGFCCVRGLYPCTSNLRILSTVTVMLVGAGKLGELVARHLREHKVKKMVIANRTRERAQVLADEVGAEVIALSGIDERLKEADIIISSTASPLPIIGKGMVERALKSRRNQPMLLVDIAVPRVMSNRRSANWPNAYLYSVDDLQSIISHNLAQRKAAAVQAETIVEQETSEFMAAARAKRQRDHPQYRGQAEQVRDDLTAKALAALEQGGDARYYAGSGTETDQSLDPCTNQITPAGCP